MDMLVFTCAIVVLAALAQWMEYEQFRMDQGPMTAAIIEGLSSRDRTNHELAQWIVEKYPDIKRSAFAPCLWRLRDSGMIERYTRGAGGRQYIHLIRSSENTPSHK